MEKPIIYSNSVHTDERGDIYTIYPPEDGSFKKLFCEDKCSFSKKGVLRGFHGDFVTGKLITCLSGSCQFVYMSINEGSDDYLKPQCMVLDRWTGISVFLPKGYVNAHLAFTDDCLFFYKLTSPYNLKNQVSIRWDSVFDGWDCKSPILQDRDRNAQTLQEYLDSVTGKVR